MKKNICHVVSGLKAGGVETMIYNYCKNMKEDYNFFLLYQHEPSQKNVQEFEKIGFKLQRIPSKIKHPIRNYIETYKYLKNNSIDVVHCHMTLMNFIPLFAAKRLNIKIRICHSHNSDVRNKSLLAKILEKILKRICINNATNLVACGEDAGKYMYGKKDFLVLNNAMDLKLYKYNAASRKKVRKKYNIDDDDILIGHIGRFTNQKNHKFLIEVFEKIIATCGDRKYKLMLLGDGELRNEIEELVAKKSLSNIVIFTGIVSNPRDYYSAFDIFLLPSLWEGLPVVSIEAQISGLLCAFSNNIDKDCKIIETTKFLDNTNVEDWVAFSKIKSNSYDRNCNEKQFNDRGLNIDTEVKKLKNLYDGGMVK